MQFFQKQRLKPELRFWFLFCVCVACVKFDSAQSINLSQYHFLMGNSAQASYLIAHNSIPSEAYQSLTVVKQLSVLHDLKASLLLAQHYDVANQLDLSEFYYKQAHQVTGALSDQAAQELSLFYQRHHMWHKLAKFSQDNHLVLEWYISQLQLGALLPPLPQTVYTKLKNQFDVDFVQRTSQLSFNSQANCAIKVVPITTSFLGLQRLKNHIKTFASDNDLNDVAVCFSDILYLSKQQLPCIASNSVKCDLRYLAQQHWPEGIRHLIIMASDGAANVNQGIMYLSSKSDFSVFKHEWLHLFGFEDEYPLTIEKQAQRCHYASATLSQLVMGESEQRLPELYPVDTCNGQPVQAYKRVKEPTLMQYLDAAMPKSYKSILHRNMRYHLGELKTFSNAMYNLSENAYWLSYGINLGDYYSYLLQALQFEEQGDFANALNQLFPLTNWPIAYSSFGRIYYQLKNFEQARHFYRLAAIEGDSYGQYFYAKMLASGEGGPKDENSAKRYLNHAAAQANPLALQLLNLAPF